MPESLDDGVLGAVLSSWTKNNRSLVNLLRALPDGGLSARAAETSPTVGATLAHIHHERLVSVAENVPETGVEVPAEEWYPNHSRAELEALLEESAASVARAVKTRVAEGRELELDFEHPIQLVLFLTSHEGYHHGQIKLALKVSGLGLSDEVAGPITWGAWRSRE